MDEAMLKHKIERLEENGRQQQEINADLYTNLVEVSQHLTKTAEQLTAVALQLERFSYVTFN